MRPAEGYRCHDCHAYFEREGHNNRITRNGYGLGLERCNDCSMIEWSRWHGAMEQEAALRLLGQ